MVPSFQTFLAITAPSLTQCVLHHTGSSTRPIDTLHAPLSIPRKRQLQQTAQDISPAPHGGDDACPCLLPNELDELNSIPDRILLELGLYTNLTKYGVGCQAHDLNTTICTEECNPNSDTSLINCDKQWCARQWCYVNTTLGGCHLAHFRSVYFHNTKRYASYATCREINTFTRSYSTLRNTTLRVAFNSNSGGWSGSFHNQMQQFSGPISSWTGPVVEFVQEAAKRADFSIAMVEPDLKLQENANIFFNSTSTYDFCVYAVALGIVDMCVAQYTITDRRASSSDFVVLGTEDLYLVAETSLQRFSSLEVFQSNISTIFRPFTGPCWAFIFFCAVPLFGLLMWLHEYGKPRSAYPKKHVVLVSDGTGGEQHVEERLIPWYEHYIRSVYASWLALLQQDWAHGVVSTGAKLNLLGMSFFILTLIAVYTANLASILTQESQKVLVANLEDAIGRGYKICAERKNMELVIALHGISQASFVVDPDDGLPGFGCPTCKSRERVFDFLSTRKAAQNPGLYCHVAIAPIEDLQVFHGNGGHCNKTNVGSIIGQAQSGFPVFESKADELIPLLINLKNDGTYDALLNEAKPKSVCLFSDVVDNDVSLNITELSGIWLVTFGLAFMGLIATAVYPYYEKHRRAREHMVQHVMGFDQIGERFVKMNRRGSWLNDNTTIDPHTGKVYPINPIDFDAVRGGPLLPESIKSFLDNSGRAMRTAAPALLTRRKQKSYDHLDDIWEVGSDVDNCHTDQTNASDSIFTDSDHHSILEMHGNVNRIMSDDSSKSPSYQDFTLSLPQSNEMSDFADFSQMQNAECILTFLYDGPEGKQVRRLSLTLQPGALEGMRQRKPPKTKNKIKSHTKAIGDAHSTCSVAPPSMADSAVSLSMSMGEGGDMVAGTDVTIQKLVEEVMKSPKVKKEKMNKSRSRDGSKSPRRSRSPKQSTSPKVNYQMRRAGDGDGIFAYDVHAQSGSTASQEIASSPKSRLE